MGDGDKCIFCREDDIKMMVYQIMEYRSGEYINWGVFSTKENANIFLSKHNWDKDEDFIIIECELDEYLNKNI